MLPLNDITQLAIKVQSATVERENTAVRVGTAIAELCKYVNQLPTVAGFSFVPSASGVDLVIKTLTEAGQEATTALAIPLLSAEKAGVFTPQMLTALKADVRKDFSKFEQNMYELIQASEEVMSRQVGEVAQKAQDNETAISQLGADIARLDSFVRTSCKEERQAVEQLLGAIEREELGQKVFYLSRFIPDDALEALRAKFPALRIEQPPYSVVQYHDDVPTGTFATNHDNQTGVAYGKPYECSGHVKRILDNRFRVMLKRGASGTKRFVRLNQDNPLLSATGETINYDGDHGWPFVHEPLYWYKGVNDHLHASHFAVFSSLEDEPPRPEGKRLELSELEKTAGVRISGNDTFERYSQFKETLSGHSSYKVSVRGYRFVRIPVTANADDAIAVFDEGGRVLQRINPSALEGVYAGSYVVVPLAEGADFVAFSLPEPLPLEVSSAQGFVWLTASGNPADWEPEWVRHEARFCSYNYAKFSQVGAAQKMGDFRAFIGTKQGWHAPVVKNQANQETPLTAELVFQALREGLPTFEGFSPSRYEDFKDLMQLYYARYGQRNAESRLNSGQALQGQTDRVYHIPHGAYSKFRGADRVCLTVFPNGTEHEIGMSSFMGYAYQTTASQSFYDTITHNGKCYQGVMTRTGQNVSPVLGRSRLLFAPTKGQTVEGLYLVKHHTNGLRLDILPAQLHPTGASTDHYATDSKISSSLLDFLLRLNTHSPNFLGNVAIVDHYTHWAENFLRLSTTATDCTEVATYADLEA